MDKRDRFNSLFAYYAQDIDWRLLRAQALAESDMNPAAVSRVGAEGLTQAMPATWREVMGHADPFNPEAAIQFQSVYMARLLRRFNGHLPRALAAYNWGQGNISRVVSAHGDDWLAHCPDETQQYVAKILDLYAVATEAAGHAP